MTPPQPPQTDANSTDTNSTNGGDELRQEYRLDARETVYLEQAGSDLLISTSLDISANGLRVITDCPLPADSIVRTCVQLKSGEHFVLVCEVKWAQPYGDQGEFLVGLSLFESEDTDIQGWKEMIAARCL